MRIRKTCPICKKRFYQHYYNQKYCCIGCRIKNGAKYNKEQYNKLKEENPEKLKELNRERARNYRKTDAWKTYIREYEREYRKSKKWKNYITDYCIKNKDKINKRNASYREDFNKRSSKIKEYKINSIYIATIKNKNPITKNKNSHYREKLFNQQATTFFQTLTIGQK